MLLGLHTYSFHLHGMGQNWGGFQLDWEPVWDVFGLMDEAVKLGLDGLHLTAVDLGSTQGNHLSRVRQGAEDRGLYLEYNFSLDASAYDPRLTHTIEEGVRIAHELGSDIGKISMDIHRPRPLCGSSFHPEVVVQLDEIARKAAKAAPLAEEAGVRLCLENHTEAFADEVVFAVNRANHAYVGACVDTNNSLMVGEDPIYAVQRLAPLAFTNHFSDHRIELEPYGCRITGVACGEGDVPMQRAYRIIQACPQMRRLNLEVEFDPGVEDPEIARQREYEAVVRSIRFAREVLGVRREAGS